MDRLMKIILAVLIIGALLSGMIVPLVFLNTERAGNHQIEAAWAVERQTLQDKITGQSLIIEALQGMLTDLIANVGPLPSRITPDDFQRSGDNITIILRNTIATTVADTGSMLPWLDAGITVVLELTDKVSVGDVAVYRNEDGGLVIHRIVGEQDGRWIFKGDNNYVTEIVDKDCVVWRLIAVFY